MHLIIRYPSQNDFHKSLGKCKLQPINFDTNISSFVVYVRLRAKRPKRDKALGLCECVEC